MPVVCARHGADAERQQRHGNDAQRQPRSMRHTTPLHSQADAASRSMPAANPCSRRIGGDSLVVDGRVGVDPVALRIHAQCEDLRQVGALQQHLLARRKRRTSRSSSISFIWNSSPYCRRSSDGFASRSRVGQLSTTVRSRSTDAKSSTLCVASNTAAFRLRHVFSASCTYARKRRVLDQPPRLVHDAHFQRPRLRGIEDALAHAMQHVEQQRLEQRRVGPHRLEVEDLQAIQRQRVARRCRTSPRTGRLRPTCAVAPPSARGSRLARVKRRRWLVIQDEQVLDRLVGLAILEVAQPVAVVALRAGLLVKACRKCSCSGAGVRRDRTG